MCKEIEKINNEVVENYERMNHKIRKIIVKAKEVDKRKNFEYFCPVNLFKKGKSNNILTEVESIVWNKQ